MRYADRILNRIKKLYAKEFQVYSCTERDGAPRVAFQAEFTDREPFMLVMTPEAAHRIGLEMLASVMTAAPEVMFPAEIVAKLNSGELSVEQLKELV